MVQNVLYAIGVFVIWCISIERINSWFPTIRFLVNLLGIGLPVCLILEPLFYKYFKNYQFRTKGKEWLLWRELLKSTHFISDILKSVAVIFARVYFNDFVVQLGGTLKLIINLITIGIPLYYAYEWYKAFLRYKRRQEENNRFIQGLTGRYFSSATQPEYQKPVSEEPLAYEQSPSLFTSAQIEQLNEMRSHLTISDAQHFPKIRLSGKNMPNLVPGAGLFSAKIERQGTIQNLVVMLSSMLAVSEFEKLCYSYASLPKDFWAEGYILPSRAGLCYSVLLVTSFRFCGKKINF